MPRLTTTGLLCLLALAPGAAGAQNAIPPPRYAFIPAADGAMRLDTVSGEVTLCTDRQGPWHCAPFPDQGASLAAKIASLSRSVDALEAASEDEPTVPADDRPEALVRVWRLADTAIQRLFGLVAEVKADLRADPTRAGDG